MTARPPSGAAFQALPLTCSCSAAPAYIKAWQGLNAQQVPILIYCLASQVTGEACFFFLLKEASQQAGTPLPWKRRHFPYKSSWGRVEAPPLPGRKRVAC